MVCPGHFPVSVASKMNFISALLQHAYLLRINSVIADASANRWWHAANQCYHRIMEVRLGGRACLTECHVTCRLVGLLSRASGDVIIAFAGGFSRQLIPVN